MNDCELLMKASERHYVLRYLECIILFNPHSAMKREFIIPVLKTRRQWLKGFKPDGLSVQNSETFNCIKSCTLTVGLGFSDSYTQRGPSGLIMGYIKWFQRLYTFRTVTDRS